MTARSSSHVHFCGHRSRSSCTHTFHTAYTACKPTRLAKSTDMHVHSLAHAHADVQFVSEGLSSILVLIASRPEVARETANSLRLTAFLMLLVPVFLPVMQKFYDGVIVNVNAPV